MITRHDLGQEGGTSFHKYTITTTVTRLIELFGEPQEQSNDITDKVQNEWVLETSEGVVFTVYDWKEYMEFSQYGSIEFHIGSHEPRHSHIAWQELLEVI